MESREELLKASVRQMPLAERLKECRRRIANMCSERRGPKMTIPVQYYDDDFFICTTLEDALEAQAAETVQSVTEWANETFGPATIQRQVERARQEFLELEQIMSVPCHPNKLAEEAADVVICLYRVIGTLDPEAINKKMAKNRARKWNVGPDGCGQHITEGL